MNSFLSRLLPLLLILSGSPLAGEPMNVVFFLVDDMGYHDLSLTGSQTYETPRIDSLAADALSLDNGHVAYPRCVPSRFAFITGVHPSRAEAEGQNVGNLELSRVTLAEALKAHGYTTYFAGKWHLGHTPDRFPDKQGFDINVGGGSAGATASHFAPFGSEKSLTGPETIEAEPGAYLTDVLTDKTVEFIEANKDKPFLVYFSHYAVHTPIQGKPDKTQRYAGKIKSLSFEGEEYVIGEDGRELRHQDNPRYAAMVESVDESLGRVVETLKRLGIYDNTIIILTSDHGGLSNSGSDNKRELATSNLPLRAGKGHLYQGGLRVPVLVRWPGLTKPGSVASFPITGMDFYPTILEMLGLPLQPQDHVDGVSFVPGIRGDQAFNADRSFFWYSDKGRITSTGDRNAAAIRRGQYKLIEFFNENRVELYDLGKDIGEQHNLAAQMPELRDALHAELKDWKREMKVKDKKQRVAKSDSDE